MPITDFETKWKRRVRTPADAVRFINAAGYCLLFPIKGVALRSLYSAAPRSKKFAWDKEMGGKKLVWDKGMERLWGWKDELPRKKRAFYGKYFKGRGTFIALKLLPHFLAMEEAAAAPDDYERFYVAARISHDARAIWEALARHGAMATLELRHACKMESQAGNRRYKKAMLELQRKLIVVHSGTEQETAAWASGKFELVSRAFPRQTAAARKISPAAARAIIVAKYLESYPGAQPRELSRLFG